MKLGPLHLLKDRTYRRLQQTINELTAQLTTRYASMHPMGNVRVAPPMILEPDPPSERVFQAVARVFPRWQDAIGHFVLRDDQGDFHQGQGITLPENRPGSFRPNLTPSLQEAAVPLG